MIGVHIKLGSINLDRLDDESIRSLVGTRLWHVSFVAFDKQLAEIYRIFILIAALGR